MGSKRERSEYFKQYNKNRPKKPPKRVEVECTQCGQRFLNSKQYQKRCPDCKNKKRDNSVICIECGVTFTAKRKTVATKYCPEHRSWNMDIKTKAQAREKNETYRVWKRNYYRSKYKEDPQKCIDGVMRSRRNNPGSHRRNAINYRVRRMNAVGQFTQEEWDSILRRFDYKCVDCGRGEPEVKITVGHAIPLKMGGSNFATNLIPQCASCNASQGARWIHPLADPDEVASLIIAA